MDTSYDKVISYLTEEQGLSLKEAEEIMVLCIEQGMNPVEIFGRGLVDMLNLLPKKKKVEPAKPQPTGTPAQGNLLTKKGTAQNFTGGRTPFTSTSPVPAASSPLPKPPTKPAVSPGQMRIPGMSDAAQALRNVTRNPNTGMPGGSNAGLTMSGGSAAARNQSIFKPQPTRTAPSLPKPPVRIPVSMRALNLAKGPLAVGAEMGANALLEPLAKKAGEEIAKASLRGIAAATGKTDKARAAVPSLYGAKGPDLTPDIVQGVKSREPRGMSNIPPAEGPVNNPNFGKKPAPVKPAPATKLSAAAKDFDANFAAARKAGKAEFTWRGKRYNTKLK